MANPKPRSKDELEAVGPIWEAIWSKAVADMAGG